MIYKSKIYPGVCSKINYSGNVTYTSEFIKWAEDVLVGFYGIGILNDQIVCLIFDNQEDLIAYEMVWQISYEEPAVNFNIH
jgi:hypothetical protein